MKDARSSLLYFLTSGQEKYDDVTGNINLAIGQNENIYCHSEINGTCEFTNSNWYLAVYKYRSRNYTNYDKLTYSITWNTNQWIDTGAVVSGPGLEK